VGTIDPSNPKDAKAAIVFGLIVTAIGAFPFLSALNIIPADPSDFSAPRWLVALIAGAFPAVGLFLVSMGLSNCLKNERAISILKLMGPMFLILTILCFVGGGAIFLTLQFFNPTGTASINIGPFSFFLPPQIAKYTDRIFIGFFALMLDAVFIVMLGYMLKEAFRTLMRTRSKISSKQTGS
jgi:hypothetical protein